MNEQFNQNKVSAAVWSWNESISGKGGRQPSLVLSLVTLAAGWLISSLLYCYGNKIISLLAFVISLCVFIAARFYPGVYSIIENVFERFSGAVGKGLTWIFLVPFFYICFPIGRLIQILQKKDPMARKFEPDNTSYWKTCDKTSSNEEYKRQF